MRYIQFISRAMKEIHFSFSTDIILDYDTSNHEIAEILNGNKRYFEETTNGLHTAVLDPLQFASSFLIPFERKQNRCSSSRSSST